MSVEEIIEDVLNPKTTIKKKIKAVMECIDSVILDLTWVAKKRDANEIKFEVGIAVMQLKIIRKLLQNILDSLDVLEAGDR